MILKIKNQQIQIQMRLSEIAQMTFYLQKESQKEKAMWYQHPKKLHHIRIHVAEVFITNTNLNADLCMDINEY